MKIDGIDAFAMRIPRDLKNATGTAGSPTLLRNTVGDYRWSEVYPALYPVQIETALLRVRTNAGLVGWGEAQAPLAPQVVTTIVERLLKPILVGSEFDGSKAEIQAFWDHMYSAMRVRGQTGGFMLDAISGIDLALWDLAGQIANQPVSLLIAGEEAKSKIPSYIT